MALEKEEQEKINEEKLRVWLEAEESSKEELERLNKMHEKLWDKAIQRNKINKARRMNFGMNGGGTIKRWYEFKCQKFQ